MPTNRFDTLIKVMVFASDQSAGQVRDGLEKNSGFQLAGIFHDLSKWEIRITQSAPQVILVESGLLVKKNKEILGEMARKFPQVSLIVILLGNDANQAQEAILQGATAFIAKPFPSQKLLDTIRRAHSLHRRQALSKSERSSPAGDFSTFAFFAPGGGVGCSTLAVNTALFLSQMGDGDVLLIDGNQYFGQAAMMLNLVPQNTLADLLSYSDRITDEIARGVVAVHSSGLHVLAGPQNVIHSRSINPEDLFRIVQSLKSLYSYVVIDAGSSLNENTVTLLDSVFRILLVIDTGLTSVRGARSFIEIAETLNYGKEKMLLTVNRVNRKGGISVQQIERLLSTKAFGLIPDDAPLAFEAINLGVPIMVKKPASLVSKAIRKLAGQLITLSEDEQIASGLETAQNSETEDDLSRSSRLG
ncbi:MAG TPA: AAA family ATPase [Anaerolineales bacterium]|nr:AAA family ATPase [Anaerolineales bacterium]